MKVICQEETQCFAKFGGECTILTEILERKPCPFCKPHRDYTNDVYYPARRYDIRYEYGKRKELYG